MERPGQDPGLGARPQAQCRAGPTLSGTPGVLEGVGVGEEGRWGYNGPLNPPLGSGSPEIRWTRLWKAEACGAARRWTHNEGCRPEFSAIFAATMESGGQGRFQADCLCPLSVLSLGETIGTLCFHPLDKSGAFSLRVSRLSRPLVFLLLTWVLETRFPACRVQCWEACGALH